MTERTRYAMKLVAVASLVILVLSVVVKYADEPLGIAGGPPLVSPWVAALVFVLTAGLLIGDPTRK